MSKFRVGQRVRIVRIANNPANVGREAIIIEAAFRLSGDPVPVPCQYVIRCTDNGDLFSAADWMLEPATDCYDKIEWSECVWKPEHLRVGA